MSAPIDYRFEPKAFGRLRFARQIASKKPYQANPSRQEAVIMAQSLSKLLGADLKAKRKGLFGPWQIVGTYQKSPFCLVGGPEGFDLELISLEDDMRETLIEVLYLAPEFQRKA